MRHEYGLTWTMEHAANGSEFFRERIKDPGAIRTTGDLERLPLTTKEELREAYPFGWTCVPLDQVVRIHASTGTTGRRIVATYTQHDLDDWSDMFRRCYEFAGVTREDRIQVTPGYGLWTAGIGFQLGAEKLGAMVVPTGPGNLDLQFEFLVDFQSTVFCATSSFGLLMAEEAQRRGLRDRLNLRIGIFGSERWGESMRVRMRELLGLECFDIYGLTELYGPGTGIDCGHHTGIHYWNDYYLVEIVDPETGRVLPEGTEGEIVLTTLRKEAMPLVRYRTRDISRLVPGDCPCGSRYPRLARLTGRTDDMVKVRGVQVYPAQVDTVLSQIDGLGSEYQIVLTRAEGRDVFQLRVEALSEVWHEELPRRVAEELRHRIGVRPDVEILTPSALPRSERKTRRVFDERE
jgi:phenylacetate-CoA ligase